MVRYKNTSYILTEQDVVIKKAFPFNRERAFKIAEFKDVICENVGNGLSNICL